jgi:hypothetical protein
MPVVNPGRVTEELAERSGALRRPLVVVAHFNHAVEVTPLAATAAARLRARGIDVLNQSVLLAGINDEPETPPRAALGPARRARAALRPAPRRPRAGHLAPAHERGARPGSCCVRCAAAFRVTCCPSTCSTCPAGTARSRSTPAGPATTPDGRLLLVAPDGARVEYADPR